VLCHNGAYEPNGRSVAQVVDRMPFRLPQELIQLPDDRGVVLHNMAVPDGVASPTFMTLSAAPILMTMAERLLSRGEAPIEP
jgi:hypothetical protein